MGVLLMKSIKIAIYCFWLMIWSEHDLQTFLLLFKWVCVPFHCSIPSAPPKTRWKERLQCIVIELSSLVLHCISYVFWQKDKCFTYFIWRTQKCTWTSRFRKEIFYIWQNIHEGVYPVKLYSIVLAILTIQKTKRDASMRMTRVFSGPTLTLVISPTGFTSSLSQSAFTAYRA